MTEDEYIAQRLDNQIDWYGSKSAYCQQRYKQLRMMEILGAALIPFLAGMGDRALGGSTPVLIGAIGVAIALAAAAASLYKFHENWIQYRVACEQLLHEKFLFVTRSGPYIGDDRFRQLVERCEAIMNKESTAWAQASQKTSSLPVRKPEPPELEPGA